MKIIACQDDFIMMGVEMIEMDDTEIRFENGRYHQFWHFDSEEEAEKAFTAVWKEINSSARTSSDCFLDETLIKARVMASLKKDAFAELTDLANKFNRRVKECAEINDKKTKKAGKHAR